MQTVALCPACRSTGHCSPLQPFAGLLPVVALLLRGREGANQEILAVPIQMANSCGSCWPAAQSLPLLPVFGVTCPSLCGQQRCVKKHQAVPRCRAHWQDIDSPSLSALKGRVDALPVCTAAINGQRLQRALSLFLCGCLPPVSHSLSLTASG